MKTIVTILFLFFVHLSYSQDLFSPLETKESINENYHDKKIQRKNTDTLKLIFQRIDSLYLLVANQEKKIASEYKLPLEQMKVQQAKSDSLIARQTLEINALKQEATNFIAEKNKKEEQIKKLNDDATKLTAEITLKQNNIDLIAQQINQQIQVLKNASYTIDPAWIDQLINTCNQFKDKSKITNYAWLSEFKTKSAAITLVMIKMQTARFLKKADIDILKADFDRAYGLENSNFTQLIGDKNRCLEMLENYTDAFCDVFENIKIVLEMKSFQPKQREDFLLAKSYKAALEYPMLQTVIAEVIKSGYTVNPLKGKIDCE